MQGELEARIIPSRTDKDSNVQPGRDIPGFYEHCGSPRNVPLSPANAAILQELFTAITTVTAVNIYVIAHELYFTFMEFTFLSFNIVCILAGRTALL